MIGMASWSLGGRKCGIIMIGLSVTSSFGLPPATDASLGTIFKSMDFRDCQDVCSVVVVRKALLIFFFNAVILEKSGTFGGKFRSRTIHMLHTLLSSRVVWRGFQLIRSFCK